ncbi:SDR family NAD(P)-dependent oxidoreductase [Amycolatopsis suaedae]|uniref:SDR family NAD(P)-dependent oxidoreductase n=1 Tax=Amycolatopsis suaedae TaxID=2510978 RepID=A0A4Q7J1C3_9PSEU|nr:SDR family NAD(P)-dependent oxidoreductase [Amycolatopsis suaedae]RZQ60629.1 SDR family NAD(P)-dependent oxidoreductase [Amycolatopsis suaedae]
MRQFTDRVAVVTGAGSGIGRALARDLAVRGAQLALSDVDGERLSAVVAECESLGAKVSGQALDVGDRAAVLAYADRVAEEFGRVELVVNNAGVALKGTVAEMDWADLDWIVGVNFWGVVHGSKAFLPHLIAAGEGHLVNISSVFGLIGVPTQSAYNATKFAVRGFTEALRQEMVVAGHRVGVSCVHPGGVRTNIARDARGLPGDERASAAKLFDRVARTSPERAARTILRGVQRDRARILVGPDAYLIDALPRVLSAGYQRLVAGVAKRLPL